MRTGAWGCALVGKGCMNASLSTDHADTTRLHPCPSFTQVAPRGLDEFRPQLQVGRGEVLQGCGSAVGSGWREMGVLSCMCLGRAALLARPANRPGQCCPHKAVIPCPSLTTLPPAAHSLPQPHPLPPNLAERVRVQQEVDGYYAGDGSEYLGLSLTAAARAAKKTLWELEPADLTNSICNPNIRINQKKRRVRGLGSRGRGGVGWVGAGWDRQCSVLIPSCCTACVLPQMLTG